MKINPLTVGPIVGATTATSVRLWGRGLVEFVTSGPRRCVGVARLRPLGAAQFGRPAFFKMNPNFDMTGVVIIDELSPETEYEVQIGCFFPDLGYDQMLDWRQANTARFRTGTDDKSKGRTFVFGSCRYLLRILDSSLFDDRGDKIFRSILEQIEAGRQTDMLLMAGDQIYADDLTILSADNTLDEYNQRYRDVFSQPYIRALMSRLPTYMTLDDHEIENDWPAEATEKDWLTKYPQAIRAYTTYQMSHSPLFAVSDDKRIVGIPDKFWYTFQDGCCDFFVMDARTERYLPEDEAAWEIIGQDQMEALKTWLVEGTDRVKFIVSSVPVFPNTRDRAGRGHLDKWSGFPRQRNELLDFIRDRGLKRVVFLSGDVHNSMSAELVSSKAPNFKIISIISSPFFQPFYLLRRFFKRAFILGGPLPDTSDGSYQVTNGGPIYSDNNFTRVTVDLEQIKIEVFSRKGTLEQTKTHSFVRQT